MEVLPNNASHLCSMLQVTFTWRNYYKNIVLCTLITATTVTFMNVKYVKLAHRLSTKIHNAVSEAK